MLTLQIPFWAWWQQVLRILLPVVTEWTGCGGNWTNRFLVAFCCFGCFLLLTALHTIDYVTRLLPARSLNYIEVESYLGRSRWLVRCRGCQPISPQLVYCPLCLSWYVSWQCCSGLVMTNSVVPCIIVTVCFTYCHLEILCSASAEWTV